jgi:hypothetical protein
MLESWIQEAADGMVQEISTEIYNNTRKYNKQMSEYLCAAGEKPNPEKKTKTKKSEKKWGAERVL